MSDRIAELERVTRELRQDTRELFGLLELAQQRIRELEDTLNVAAGRIAVLEHERRSGAGFRALRSEPPS